MRKAIWSVLTALSVLASVNLAQAEEPKAEPAKKESVEERQERRVNDLQDAVSNQDFDKALKIIEEILGDKEVSKEDQLKAGMTQFVILVKEKKDGAKACVVAKKLSGHKDISADMLNELAWLILDTEELQNRDLDVAMSIAKQAAEINKYESPAILDTLARAYFEKKDLDKAIEFQTKAAEKAKTSTDENITEEIKAQIQETLDKYKAKKAEKK